MKDDRPFWVRMKSFVRREIPPCVECERLRIPHHYDRFRTRIVEIVSMDLPKPWEHFSDDALLDVIATMKMGCDTHQNEFYNHVGERTGRAKPYTPNAVSRAYVSPQSADDRKCDCASLSPSECVCGARKHEGGE